LPPESTPEPTYDELALALRAALDRVVPGLARVAARFVALRGWVPFGFARVHDFARERLDRSGRWLKDLASLGELLDRSATLADAFLGCDGGSPIGQVAALTIGRVASDESTTAWIDLARRVPVRQLKAEARRARQAGSSWPPSGGGSVPEGSLPSGEDSGSGNPLASTAGDFWLSRADARLGRVRLGLPAPVKVAFDRGRELHHAVCGSDGGVASFVEALVGEAFAGPHPPNPEVGQLPMTRDWAALEALLFRNTDRWAHLPQATALAEAVKWMYGAGRGGPAELVQQLEQLIALRDRLQRQLGRLLALMGHERGWAKLGFVGLEHYAEQRLGISRTTARDRARLHRVLWRLPVVREAYEQGSIGFQSALLILRALGRHSAPESLQRQWVERASTATVKRLKDEAEAIGPATPRRPLSDEQWHASLRREPGDAKAQVQRLGLQALAPEVKMDSLGLTLPEDLALDFLAAVRGWRDALERQTVRADMIAVRMARTFSTAGRGVPQWLGLFAMLEDFADTWDDPRAMPKRKADRIYARDGWRCTAPGCSSRRNLESHHLVYRSHGGSRNEESNQITACRFHHQMGEHGALARCRGVAPLDVEWRLGSDELAATYKNELRAG
jgi:hypothetical protein